MKDYLSSETCERALLVLEVADALDYDIGDAIAKKINGDMIWFILTLDSSLRHVYILIVTPHGCFTEYSVGTTEPLLGAVTNIAKLLEELQEDGFRKLTREELKDFGGVD